MTYRVIDRKEFDSLAAHLGHSFELVGAGVQGRPPWTGLSLECRDCSWCAAYWELKKPKQKLPKGPKPLLRPIKQRKR